MRIPTTLVVLSALFAGEAAAQKQAPSEETIAFFRNNCSSCHTIGGGRLTGPDLKNVTKRQKREWLAKFIQDPNGVIDSGDQYAQKLLREASNARMQQVPGLDPTRVNKLLDLIEAESVAEKPLFAGNPEDDRPLTAADVERGRRLFRGAEGFASGAPACISCHSVNELSGLGGGRLGPDLTSAFARLEGRKALAAWLAAPPSEVMRPVFTKHRLESGERLALVAYLKNEAAKGVEDPPSTFSFVLLGFALAGVLLLVFDYLWRNRYRAVRRPLVERFGRRTAQ